MRYSLSSKLLLLLGSAQLAVSSPNGGDQAVLAPATDGDAVNDATVTAGKHSVDEKVLAAVKAHSDPVEVMLSLHPEQAATLAEPRLIHVFGEKKAEWMTEGDKLRLRRKGKKFRDITDYQELYTGTADAWSGKASEDPFAPPIVAEEEATIG